MPKFEFLMVMLVCERNILLWEALRRRELFVKDMKRSSLKNRYVDAEDQIDAQFKNILCESPKFCLQLYGCNNVWIAKRISFLFSEKKMEQIFIVMASFQKKSMKWFWG